MLLLLYFSDASWVRVQAERIFDREENPGIRIRSRLSRLLPAAASAVPVHGGIALCARPR